MTVSCYDESMNFHEDKSLLRRGIFTQKTVISQKKRSKKPLVMNFKKLSVPKLSFSGKFFRKKKTIFGFAVIFLLLVGGGGYWLYQYNLAQDPTVIFKKKLQTITQQVSKSVHLPTNETPVIATVSDKTKLPNEPFFNLAQNGDKILMYKKDKKAILYRPSTGEVITTATLDFQDPTPPPARFKTAVAGASTSAVLLPNTEVSANPENTTNPSSSNASYHPQ